MSNTTNITIGKNAPSWLKEILREAYRQGEDIKVTDFTEEVPDITAASEPSIDYQDKIRTSEKMLEELIKDGAPKFMIKAASNIHEIWIDLFVEKDVIELTTEAHKCLDNHFQVDFDRYYVQSLIILHMMDELEEQEEINKQNYPDDYAF